MALGGGKYDKECTEVRDKTRADGVVLMVLNGSLGSGFSAQLNLADMMRVPSLLREVADSIEQDMKEIPHGQA